VAFIHPNLEYATAVWDPHLDCSLRTYKTLNLFSILHVGSVSKDGTMPIVTCCIYLEHTPMEKTRYVSYVQDCQWIHWLPECTPSVQALHKSLHWTHTNPLTLLQTQACTNSLLLLFLTHYSNLE